MMAEHSALPSPLSEAYDPKRFRQWGHELIDLLSDYIEQLATDTPVLQYNDPEAQWQYWQQDAQQAPTDTPLPLFEDILQRSIHLHHPRYIGHQVATPAFAGALAGLVSDLLNNGTGVYEMGMVSNALERVLTDWLAQRIGFDAAAGGFLTSGGSLANLTALLAARQHQAFGNVWKEGHGQALAIMVSEEAHYCIDRAARIMGLGDAGIIKVPVNEKFQIETELLNAYYQQALEAGRQVIAVVGCACSTATGSFDHLEALAAFCAEKQLWLHVDAAHGGAVVFSEQHKALVKGIEKADSVTIDFHKMLLTPALATALVFRQSGTAYQVFAQQAQYLWDAQQTTEWQNSGKRTFECTKFMMAIKAYAILKTHGEIIFTQNVERLFALAQRFADLVQQHPDFELALRPEANIVNFRYINTNGANLNDVNRTTRQALLHRGSFYIVQTMLYDALYLRVSIMNPLTSEADLVALLHEVAVLGATAVSQNINLC